MDKAAEAVLGSDAEGAAAREGAVRVKRTAAPGARRAALFAAAVAALALPLAACSSGPGPGSRLPDSGTSPARTSAAPTGTTAGATPTASGGMETTGTTTGTGRAIPARLEADGTTVTVGDPAAAHTLTVYEDPRCPICEQFEQANAAQIQALEAAGKIRVQYTFASFIDQNSGGGGSKRAVNALRAALAASADGGGFVALHTLVYQYQPNEQTDGFTADFLLQLAGKVPGLRSAAFDAAVRGQKYASFVSASENAFIKSGAGGTPMVKIDGDKVSNDDGIFDATSFRKILSQHGVS
ncbi:DsbA family protein [Actinacidiphila sp. bgisy144]|uniref:DsbA family protein n=1 Tax=Actinacidiphila sp. bgisy144 TaxID=3413791 RepID=UPI003EBB5E97